MAKARTVVGISFSNKNGRVPRRKALVLLALTLTALASGTAAEALSGESSSMSNAPTIPSDIKSDWQQSPADGLKCPQLQCDANTASQRRKDFGPAQPVDTSKPFMTPNAALQAARSRSENPQPDQATLPATEKSMTMGEIDTVLGIPGDPLIADSRPVLVVTVHGARTIFGPPGRAPVKQSVFTDVYDAPTGQLILEVVGVAALG